MRCSVLEACFYGSILVGSLGGSLTMQNNMSIASKHTIWVLRGTFLLTFLFLSIVCVNSYYKNLDFSARKLSLENFSHKFDLFADTLYEVRSTAHMTEDFLRTAMREGSSLSSVNYAKFINQKQDMQTTIAHAAFNLKSLQSAWDIADSDLVTMVKNKLRVDDPFQIYHRLFERTSFAQIDNVDELAMKIEELDAHFHTVLATSLYDIRDVLIEESEGLEAGQQEMVSNAFIYLGVILLAIAIFVFIPMDFMIRHLLVGFFIKSNEAEKALLDAQQSERAKSEFLATMSHEIRTPMNGVLGMAELLNKTELNERQQTFSNVILKSGHTLLCIINDILDFSKIDAQQLQLQDEVCDVAEIVDEVASLLAIRANEKNIELVVSIQPDISKSVSVDGVRLRQVIINIIGNAIKFTEKGHVLIKVSSFESNKTDHTCLRFEIEDTGIGIPEDKIGHIFEKFSQADSSNTRRFEGTGLGLAISARLVDMMGGKIAVISELGVGSKFLFSLDLLVEVDENFERITDIQHDEKMRALVVDDNEVNRAILVEQLISWGHDCIAVESGAMALKFLNAAQRQHDVKVDVVILDFQMPEMSGADVLKEIRETEAIADTKILLLSPVDQLDLTYLLQQYHLDGHLSKPVRGSELKQVIDQILTGSHVKKLRSVAHALGEPVAQSSTGNEIPKTQQKFELDVLVCEDNEVNQLVISQYLEMTDYTFKIVGNGKLGVSEWQASSPRIILMDVSMPEMNGHEATSRIRDIENDCGLERTPIIGVTAHAQVKDKEECLNHGMDDVLNKPLSYELLFNTLDNWMVNNRKTRSMSV